MLDFVFLQKPNWKIGFLGLARLSARPLRPPRVCNFIKFPATARKFFANVRGHKFIGQFRCLPSKKHYGADSKSTIRNSGTTNPTGPPSTNPVGADLQQIQLTRLRHPTPLATPLATILQGRVFCWALVGVEGGAQTMASHFAINFLPITGRGWLDVADSFAAFSILQITFFGGKFLRNRMWIGLRWDRMSDGGKKVCNASKNKDTFGKQPNLIISRTQSFVDNDLWTFVIWASLLILWRVFAT